MFSDPELQVAKIQATGFISFEALRDAAFLRPAHRPKPELVETKLGQEAKADAGLSADSGCIRQQTCRQLHF
jgi:hypothetical protein